jgi:hypothetical protein
VLFYQQKPTFHRIVVCHAYMRCIKWTFECVNTNIELRTSRYYAYHFSFSRASNLLNQGDSNLDKELTLFYLGWLLVITMLQDLCIKFQTYASNITSTQNKIATIPKRCITDLYR